MEVIAGLAIASRCTRVAQVEYASTFSIVDAKQDMDARHEAGRDERGASGRLEEQVANVNVEWLH
jgi:hypothetical protein